MRKHFIFGGIVLATAALAQAATITVGTAGNSTLSTPSKPSPSVGPIVSLSGLANTANPLASITTGGVTFSSKDGVQAIPYSTMYNTPNEIFDAGSNGVANLMLSLAGGVNALGFGVTDSDGVSISLQILGANGVALGSPVVENLASTADVNGNSYFVIKDTAYDIYGVTITQSVANANYSGLAVGDIEVAPTPEPTALYLLGAGLALVGGLRWRGNNA